jgi:glycosyltransferase involved in cell wall biosynthesis
MRVLLLAPQPFYQERGTPIAVRIAVESLTKRLRASETDTPVIDLLCYGEGESIEIPGVRIIRIPTPAFLKGIRPGISLKKLACDIIFLFVALSLVLKSRSSQYSVIHAVEESVFIAWLIKKVWGIPYIYDMDSSLSMQLTEKWWWCKPLYPIMNFFEGIAVRGSIAVAPVCDALSLIASRHGSPHTVILRDVSLLPVTSQSSEDADRNHAFGLSLGDSQSIVLYVGNLESYQGIDLLLEAFTLVANHPSRPHLVIIGGTPSTIEHYREKAQKLLCSESVSFLGPKPVAQLKNYLELADILASPRIKGNNTPMKIYSYLHSGRAVIATDLPTHRQVLDDEVAILAATTPHDFAAGLTRLIEDPSLRKEIGTKARKRADRLYTLEAFEGQLFALYDEVAARVDIPLVARHAELQEDA